MAIIGLECQLSENIFDVTSGWTENPDYYDLTPTIAWVNEMKAHEYNPFHYHTGVKSELGLSSVLVLKRPESYGKEYSREEHPSNGYLEFVGGNQDPLGVSQFRVDAQVGEFYIFPYTMLHGVYPFNGDGIRRTMSYNCDLIKPDADAELQASKMGIE